MNFFKLVALGFFVAFFAGCTFTSNEVKSEKARAIYYVPKNVKPEQVRDALKAAISGRVSNIKEVCNFFPEELPEKPDHPKTSNAFGGMMSIASGNPTLEAFRLDTSNAYCSFQGSETYGTMFNKNSVAYKAAIYPYKDGYKVYIYEFYQEGADGIMGHLVKASVAKIMGSESPALFMAQVMDKFERELPQAKLINVTPAKIKEVKDNLAAYQKEL
ncbi:hypothetical protein [Caminibacter pacificus]|jgi:hypothetical protein